MRKVPRNLAERGDLLCDLLADHPAHLGLTLRGARRRHLALRRPRLGARRCVAQLCRLRRRSVERGARVARLLARRGERGLGRLGAGLRCREVRSQGIGGRQRLGERGGVPLLCLRLIRCHEVDLLAQCLLACRGLRLARLRGRFGRRDGRGRRRLL